MQVLRRWAMRPPADVRLLVVLDRPIAVYSGMVPGYVAGDYERHELEIDVVPLARRARAGVILAPAVDLDPVRREIALEGRPPIRFDLASLDVGSTVRGLDRPGVAKHALATRPIGDFVREVDARIERFAGLGGRPRVLVVGAGAAGSELAFTLDARLRGRGLSPSIAVVTADDGLLASSPARVRRAARREARRRGVETLAFRRVVAADAAGIVVEDAGAGPSGPGEAHLPADWVVWATGAAPIGFPRGECPAQLARSEDGFLAVRDTLQCVGFDHVFAVGDCARMRDHAWMPRAGVYAVRQGPVLEHNLRAQLEGDRLEPYRPQRDFLALLNLGGGRALGSKWGVALRGRPVHWLKDRIDRRFMERFQVLDASGHPHPRLARLGAMDPTGSEDEMPCGGCAAKLGATPLEAALDRLPPGPSDASVVLGLEARDDVAAIRAEAGDETVLHNVDVIRAFADDPHLVGRVAAANALHDVFAKGGRPRIAQAVIALPGSSPADEEEVLFQALSGVRSLLDEVGVTLVGGHTTLGEALSVGLAVSGTGPEASALVRRIGARAGDALYLTGPIGTGVVLAADMRGLARGPWVAATHAEMQRTHESAGRLVRSLGVHAATDVTGFGLAGHLLDLLEADDLGARIERAAIPFLPGAATLWAAGHRSTAHPANREAFASRVAGGAADDEAWLFDPQTSGPLLLAVDPARERETVEAFAGAGEPPIVRIGEVLPSRGGEDGKRGGHIEIQPARPGSPEPSHERDRSRYTARP